MKYEESASSGMQSVKIGMTKSGVPLYYI